LYGGESIAEQVLRVINDYDNAERVRCFIADNATANGPAIGGLNGNLGIAPEHEYLHRGGHMVDLLARVILYGTYNEAMDADEHEDCLQDSPHVAAFEAVVRSESLEKAARTWHRKGPVGTPHNLVTHSYKTPKRQSLFEGKQTIGASPDDGWVYQAVFNGGIRWERSCDNIERAIKLRNALELYLTHSQSVSYSDRLPSIDCLDAANWWGLDDYSKYCHH
jgi:hypothetical protein